jgi:hypothetical protein
MTDPFVAAMLILAAVCLVIVAVRFVREQIMYYRMHRPNCYTRKVRRWPTDGNTHRSYWSGCKRVGVE